MLLLTILYIKALGPLSWPFILFGGILQGLTVLENSAKIVDCSGDHGHQHLIDFGLNNHQVALASDPFAFLLLVDAWILLGRFSLPYDPNFGRIKVFVCQAPLEKVMRDLLVDDAHDLFVPEGVVSPQFIHIFAKNLIRFGIILPA